MKKKFLIPILGMFVCLLAFTYSSDNSSSNDELAGLFVESDNIALAEDNGWWCKRCAGGCVCVTNVTLPGLVKSYW